MRVIKFRAWGHGKMVPFVAALHGIQDGQIIPAEGAVFMQFTGLTDKNGTDIYEGDILSSEYPKEGNKNCHPVVWGHGRWNCDHSINDCCKAWRGDLNGHHMSEEIIGNIYENGDLLV